MNVVEMRRLRPRVHDDRMREEVAHRQVRNPQPLHIVADPEAELRAVVIRVRHPRALQDDVVARIRRAPHRHVGQRPADDEGLRQLIRAGGDNDRRARSQIGDGGLQRRLRGDVDDIPGRRGKRRRNGSQRADAGNGVKKAAPSNNATSTHRENAVEPFRTVISR